MDHVGQVSHFIMIHLFHPAVPNGSPSRGATLDAYILSCEFLRAIVYELLVRTGT
jgi:hypothetical protein